MGDEDHSLALAAVEQLQADRVAGKDHVLMARVKNIPRATEVLEVYQDVAGEFNPIRIDSKMSKTAQGEALASLRSRDSRVIVCVDMLGEGFDLPALKIAAVHDHHRALRSRSQFVGRFARVGGEELGEASVLCRDRRHRRSAPQVVRRGRRLERDHP